MTRRVFFSFHYSRDNWRVSIVRNAWVIWWNGEAQPFYDAAGWEQIKRHGSAAIQQWIESQMMNTSVTVVLIGAETAHRPWVKYEIERSRDLNKGLLGIRIQNILDKNGNRDYMGPNPLDGIFMTTTNMWGSPVLQPLSAVYSTYDWVFDNGRENIANWIESAATQAGR